MEPAGKSVAKVFEVGIDEPLSYDQLLILGLQNIFGMTGMFVFPGILGRSFNLAPEQIAYLYGMTFLVCGVVTILQSTLLLRLPIMQGPYAGSFASLLAVGHLQGGGLGAAYGSFFVAALIWCVLTVPIRGFSVIGLFSRFLRAPIIAGMIVIFIMIQVSNVALPGWIGQPQSPGFPAVNFFAGALAVAVIVAVSLWGGKFRRAAILIGLAAGTIGYALFRPVSLARSDECAAAGRAADVPVRLCGAARPCRRLPAGAVAGEHRLDGALSDGRRLGRPEVSSARMSQGVFAIGLGARAGGPRRRLQHHRLSRQYRHAAHDPRRLALCHARGRRAAGRARRVDQVRPAARAGAAAGALGGGDACCSASCSCTACICWRKSIGTTASSSSPVSPCWWRSAACSFRRKCWRRCRCWCGSYHAAGDLRRIDARRAARAVGGTPKNPRRDGCAGQSLQR